MESLFGSRRRHKPPASALAVSALFHLAVLFGLLAGRFSGIGTPPAPRPVAHEQPDVVWLNQEGPGGGGGGGGNRQAEPPRQVQMRGQDDVSVPATPRSLTQTPASVVQEPVVQLDVPVRALADSELTLAGVLEAAPDTPSQGPGDRGGAGQGELGGIGDYKGPGLGPGRDGGIGDGPRRIGSGVRPPVPLHQQKPQYTLEAMRARIEGAVIVECVVQPNGACTNARVLRSLDVKFGLDEQALRAAGQWRFLPGTHLGKPVPVLITIQLAFSIH